MYSGREVYYIDTMSILKSVHIFNAFNKTCFKGTYSKYIERNLAWAKSQKTRQFIEYPLQKSYILKMSSSEKCMSGYFSKKSTCPVQLLFFLISRKKIF